MQEHLFSVHDELGRRHWWFRGRRRAILGLGEAVLPAAGTVVDVGCGTGDDIAAFSPAHHRIGVDLSEPAIDFARRSHPDVEFHVGAAPDAARDGVAAADLVLLCDVLEHIEDDVAFFRALFDRMKPGAHLLLTVPADPGMWSGHDEVYGHYRRYTADRLERLWQDQPARAVLFAPFNRYLYPLARLARATKRRLGRSWGPGSTDLVLPWRPVNALLERIMAREAVLLEKALRNGTPPARGRGVSLLALLQKQQVDGSTDG